MQFKDRASASGTFNPNQDLNIGAEAYQANRRAADYFRTVRGVGDYPRFTADAINSEGGQAIFEFLDLINQIAEHNPEQAQQLLERTRNGLKPDNRARLDEAMKEYGGAGGPGVVRVRAYSQDRDGDAVDVRAHERNAPGSGPNVQVADAEKLQPMINPVPNGKLRGNDGYGSGHFGARRGNRTHRGVDVVVQPGQSVNSPVDGIVIRDDVRVYGDDPNYAGVEIEADDGRRIKMFYVRPDLPSGTRVRAGDPVGTAQDISEKYPIRGIGSMTPHVHIEVRKDGKIVDPTEMIFGK